MEIGYQFEPLHKEEITHSQLVRYAGASGDFNPIHTVVPFAESAGLGGVIAHGMLIMGFVGQAIGQWFSTKDLVKFSTRFRAMTRPGEKITVQGHVVDETAERWICQAEAVNDVGEVKVKAFFEIKKR
ncbi:MaoC/PaaZ C-terminal domain-containing protein [Peribacillus asahii]|uniref:3-hydroxyacyl-ACP dehydratase n=1 Tax=Peribacillus asahii TaxID=228899 RepID=A0A3T0KQY8_9BACI|nr:MaoC/PaaZ C-terminal domain-containing protein [Peribacillus asahii]AZV42800.1 3-hydroxyacyl-ACP dehydratase [Peribacillus asahii]USK61719.1 3-hydroxyacyl-ACP dehydratase [Peribacillus asahii]USK72150.1 3-hydroxyacyl-ACP dehydratase [Peribacillus asahii]USK87042.1 3-hydroxyacyl-ACP dehydratase [Peribacillus asahii]